MLNGLSTLDPRSIYYSTQLEKVKALREMNGLKGAEKTEFQKKLDNKIEKRKLREVSQQLASLFINIMFKAMRKNINKHRLLKENPAENIFTDFLYQEYSLQIAKTGKFGLAEQIYEQNVQYVVNEH